MASRWFRRAPADSSARIATSKVPELTVVFWATKALINGSSEWWPDYLYGRFGLVPVTGVLAAALVVALAVQLSVRRYHTSIYWLAFIFAGVAAKEAANGLHRVGLPFVVVAVFWLVVLAVILEVWHASGEMMSPGSVCTPRQELFYWSAVGSGFALSQAVGHASAESGFTYLRGELAVVAALTAAVAVARWRFGLNPVLAFWLAFVLTCPLGGGVASWLAAGRDMGGLGLGRWPVSLSLAAVVLGLVVIWQQPAAGRRSASPARQSRYGLGRDLADVTEGLEPEDTPFGDGPGCTLPSCPSLWMIQRGEGVGRQDRAAGLRGTRSRRITSPGRRARSCGDPGASGGNSSSMGSSLIGRYPAR